MPQSYKYKFIHLLRDIVCAQLIILLLVLGLELNVLARSTSVFKLHLKVHVSCIFSECEKDHCQHHNHTFQAQNISVTKSCERDVCRGKYKKPVVHVGRIRGTKFFFYSIPIMFACYISILFSLFQRRGTEAPSPGGYSNM